MLGELVELAEVEEVDVVLVAGDLFETAIPTGEHEQVVYEALLGFVANGAEVVLVAGNHDNGRRLEAIAPVFAATKVHVVATPRRPESGGVVELVARSDGATLRVATLPFVSKRGVVKASELMSKAVFQTQQLYAERLTAVVAALTADMPADAVNVACIHAFLAGGTLGGGERQAHTLLDYSVPPAAFPANMHYVAAGHLHRHQEVGGACPIRYAGSPIQLDFSETEDEKGAVVVEAQPGTPAAAKFHRLTSGRPLVTLTGSLQSLSERAQEADEMAWIRVRLDEPPRTGLAEEVRELLPNVVDIQTIRRPDQEQGGRPSREGKGPRELFTDYLAERGVEDEPVRTLFDELHAEALEPAT